ncbi:hypothetical protein [Nostoc sp. TCL240-02]|nr:hypothetical protein [Nostoc sp. TCL240-02]
MVQLAPKVLTVDEFISHHVSAIAMNWCFLSKILSSFLTNLRNVGFIAN